MLTALITGGTGSVGQSLTSKLLKRPELSKVIIYSRDEHKQERMARSLENDPNKDKLRFFIGDIRDKYRLMTAMRGVHYVFHTAALKIVPAMEYNPMEAVKTNVMGSQNVIECAGDSCVTRLTTISTDKAVYPINLYGATKLCAEKLTIYANNLYPSSQFNVARYGNVALSHGSVIPLFITWKKLGQPLRITRMDMTRFWITINTAADFVIARTIDDPYDGVRGAIFVPDMNAYHMEDLVELYSTEGVENQMLGIRPGEKIHEQILTDNEVSRATKVEGKSGSYTVVHPDWDVFNSPDTRQVIESTRSNTAIRMSTDELKARIEALL